MKHLVRRLLPPMALAPVLGVVNAATQVGTKPPPDTFPATITVRMDLSKLHPAATKAGLICGAVAGASNAMDSRMSLLKKGPNPGDDGNALYQLANHNVFGNAYYYNSITTVDFPLERGAYSGTSTITVYVPNAMLADAQHVVFPSVSVLIACYVTVNGTPAYPAAGVEVPSLNNIAHASGELLTYSEVKLR